MVEMGKLILTFISKCEELRMPPSLERKNVEELTSLGVSHLLVRLTLNLVMKPRMWRKDRELDQLNRIENIYGQLILDKGTKI